MKMKKVRAYSHEGIKQLVDTGDFRFRAIVLFLAATGCRVGSLCSLEMRHLEKRENIYKVTIYENSYEEYFVFSTADATQALDNYFSYRGRAGETIKPSSPSIPKWKCKILKMASRLSLLEFG